MFPEASEALGGRQAPAFCKGKKVGCPKFDDAEAYVQKFTDVFKTAGIKSITVLTMEVPCCQGLPVIVKNIFSIILDPRDRLPKNV